MSWKGQDYNPSSPGNAIQKGIGLIHQETRLLKELSVAENVFVGRMITKNGIVDFNTMNFLASEQLKRLGLEISPKQLVKNLKMSAQQQIEIAKALTLNSELLILDEPMTGLDPIGRSIVRQIILDQKKQGHTVFFSSHILSDVEALCDEVIFIDKGQTQRQGPIDELLQQEQKGYELIVNITTAKLKTLLPELTAVETGQSSLINVKSQAEALSVAEKLNAASLHIAKIEETKSNLEDLLIQTLHKDSQIGGPS